MTEANKDAALTFAARRQESSLQELIEFLAIPSISTQPERSDDVRRAGEWLVRAMQEAGLENARTIDTPGHPLVYADWLHAGDEAPTVLVYGHYDVQPPEPVDLWRTPPFSPTIEDGYLYARGVSDDKGQVYIHVKAVEAYLQATGALPINLKFIVEGEEEVGGPSLAKFVPENTDLLDADVVVISDSAMRAQGQPSIVYGLRGLAYMLLDVTGPDHDIHSGHYGGVINNPIHALCHIIAHLQDEDGHILIPGFYDDVAPLDEEERALIGASVTSEERVLTNTGAPAVWGDEAYTLDERMGARPTLDVNGIVGGYTGEGSKTIIPSTVHAKISMRLAPNQDPQKIADLFEEYVKEIAPPSATVKIRRLGTATPAVIDYNTTAVAAATAACEEVFGVAPVLRREGGTIPVVGDFQRHLGLGSLMLGFGLPDDRIHSPNERFYVPNFYQGIETIIRFLDEYGRRYRHDGA
ncbi:MAG: dipeptidase [Chloroflexota bacterium]